MFAYISNENGNWRQSLNRVVTDQQAIFFNLVDDDGTALSFAAANDCTVSCKYHNGDVIFTDQTCTEVSGAVVSYTPTSGERDKMFRPGLYRFTLEATLSTVTEQSWNTVTLIMSDS